MHIVSTFTNSKENQGGQGMFKSNNKIVKKILKFKQGLEDPVFRAL